MPRRSGGPMVRSDLGRLRKARGLSQMRLAVIAGVSVDTVKKVTRGELSVTVETLWRLALALACSPCDVYPALGRSIEVPRATAPRLRRGQKLGLGDQAAIDALVEREEGRLGEA